MARREIYSPTVMAFLAMTFVVGGLRAGESPASDDKKDKEIQASFEELAKEFEYFAWHEFIYNRCYKGELRWLDAAEEKYLEQIGKLKTLGRNSSQQIVRLLKHNDPKVRSLALAALFDKDDPSLLPHIFSLADDEANAFQCASLIGVAGHMKQYALTDKTVGKIAEQMIGFYLAPLNVYMVKGTERRKGFKEYWEVRKDRKHCGSWFIAKFMRAGGGSSTISKERLPLVRALREEIDRLPKLDRAWTLLVLSGKDNARILATPDDYLLAAETLGRERLLKMLRREVDGDDPDFRCGTKDKIFAWPDMACFVLRNAEKLLKTDDADYLLKLAKDYSSEGDWPLWTSAARKLQQQKAVPK